ncbi:deoxyguanosinetriphosphate triphosphohydrolase [Hyphococcus flavus]|uniref:Deoxyguanosinetriphosphate triphosphohydrolase-like protein n=1 Tax=Hyphococcus flavus TaxID=1866326 RepID=A0AAE9ZI24_9PROT|nr:deoxyguanosinetriphosphate triphosphohydrolase [Hyphococcus flavus]WDI30630.1 deoxyguanosinetriphosphate triphosphohydrolase [Hyphococcus flavus]
MTRNAPKAFPAPLASYAARAEETRGRLVTEAESSIRTPFQRDRDRVIHSVAFRRLKHKTQVFISHEGDHYRTRLTHSLEVAQIARTLARALQLDEDLAECVALAHDLGHPPFGHTGEDVLVECMKPYNSFDHNAQTLRLLTKLEHRHADFSGLNLTWETLEGVVKHNGPLIGPLARKDEPLPAAIVEYAESHDLWLDTFPSLEAQIGAIADDIAYNNHDVDDGLRAGLFDFEEARDLPLIGPALKAAEDRYPSAPRDVLIAEAVSDLIGAMVEDVLAETKARLAALAPKDADAVRRADRAMVAFSTSMEKDLDGLRAFLHANMYRHHKVNRARSQAKRIVKSLFDLFFTEPETLPPEWRERYDGADEARREDILARIVCDYIAGMTDRYAMREYRRLFSVEFDG